MIFDLRPFRHAGDPIPQASTARNYEEKFMVASLLRPGAILEIGVRYGYSAAAFLSGSPRATYYGIDACTVASGGVTDSLGVARAMLGRNFLGRVTLAQADSQLLAELPPPPPGGWALIHVDGDHSYEGCAHDLRLAAAAGPRWILVDDITLIPDVRRATEDWLSESGWHGVFLPTYRGDMLCQHH